MSPLSACRLTAGAASWLMAQFTPQYPDDNAHNMPTWDKNPPEETPLVMLKLVNDVSHQFPHFFCNDWDHAESLGYPQITLCRREHRVYLCAEQKIRKIISL